MKNDSTLLSLHFIIRIQPMMFQFKASVADSGPVLDQYCVFGVDSLNILNATSDNRNNSCNSVQTQNVELMLLEIKFEEIMLTYSY